MSARPERIARSAELVVRRLLAVKPGEQVALVCDPMSEMPMALYAPTVWLDDRIVVEAGTVRLD